MKRFRKMSERDRRILYKEYHAMTLKEKLIFKVELYKEHSTRRADELWEYLNDDAYMWNSGNKEKGMVK